MPELKGCPWGHGAEIISVTVDDFYKQNYAVDCVDIDCCAITGYYPTKQEAVDAWNSRPAESRLHARIEELEGEVGRLEGREKYLMDKLTEINDGRIEVIEKNTALQQEVERLRKLVEDSFGEGYVKGCGVCTFDVLTSKWQESKSYKALAAGRE